MIVFFVLARITILRQHSRWLYVVLVICISAIAFTLSVAAMGMLLLYVLMLLWARKGLVTLIRVIAVVLVLFVILLFTGLLDVSIERVKFAFSQESSSVSGRINSFQEITDYANKANIVEILIGDFKSREYVMYDSMWEILIRNNGILPVLALAGLFVTIARLGYKKYRACLRFGDSEMASILFASGSFILVAVFFSFNITAYLSKFPLHFYFYMLLVLILVANPREATAGVASDRVLGFQPVNR